MDFSAAFDTVHHDVFITEATRGLKWRRSHVPDCTQRVVVNRSKSSMVKLSCGVPQGSVLEPLLFVIYNKDVSAVTGCCIVVCGIAATQMIRELISTASLKKRTDTKLLLALMNCWRGCSEQSNKLKLTADTTECIWVTTRQQQSTFTTVVPKLTVEDQPEEHVTFVYVWLRFRSQTAHLQCMSEMLF